MLVSVRNCQARMAQTQVTKVKQPLACPVAIGAGTLEEAMKEGLVKPPLSNPSFQVVTRACQSSAVLSKREAPPAWSQANETICSGFNRSVSALAPSH